MSQRILFIHPFGNILFEAIRIGVLLISIRAIMCQDVLMLKKRVSWEIVKRWNLQKTWGFAVDLIDIFRQLQNLRKQFIIQHHSKM